MWYTNTLMVLATSRKEAYWNTYSPYNSEGLINNRSLLIISDSQKVL